MDSGLNRTELERRIGHNLRGKWRLQRLLGFGGTAAVYAAVHRNGLHGAVKVLHHELRSNEEARGRFLYEGVVANRVKHSGIVNVLDDDVTADGTPFLVMELLDGEPVDHITQRSPGGKLSVEETCRITLQLLDVLEAAHACGIVHRDIKPENLFLTKYGQLKLLDFGIASSESADDKRVVTRSGYTMGTPGYMPPEQATGDWDVVGPRSDIWAVGASMVAMLTGERVHEHSCMHKLLQRTASTPVAPIRDRLPGLAPAIAGVIDRALAFEIEDRWESAAQMRAALEVALLQGNPTLPAFPVQEEVAPTVRWIPRRVRNAKSSRLVGAIALSFGILLGSGIAKHTLARASSAPETTATPVPSASTIAASPASGPATDPAIVRLSQSVAARPSAAPATTVAQNAQSPMRRHVAPAAAAETTYDELGGAAATEPSPAKQIRFVDADQLFRTRL